MEILDFIEREQLQEIQDLYASATGVTVCIIDREGNHVTEDSNGTDFCRKYTKGSELGAKRCHKCDMEGKGVYFCHSGLMDFSSDIVIEGEKLGTIMGGQVLPGEPDYDKFRDLAVELSIDPDEYINALKKVPVKTEESIRSVAKLLEVMINMLINQRYSLRKDKSKIAVIDKEIGVTTDNVVQIEAMVRDLTKVSKKQNILALNASIEAARAGEAGRGFNIVAGEMGKLSSMATEKYAAIIAKAGEIDQSLRNINAEFGNKKRESDNIHQGE
ncbi:chemotaxis protein [Lachnospiraceae bacterium]|nr:chemotaxis protein [Lachnospiraceae bacterium]